MKIGSVNYLFVLCFALLGRVGAFFQTSGGFESCSDQDKCISITTEEESASECAGNCQYKICLELEFFNRQCNKGGSISHTCLVDNSEDPNVCNPADTYPLTSWTEVKSGRGYTPLLSNGGRQCQTVDPGATATFILKDGSGCSGPISRSGTTCAPTTERSCTGNGNIGKECVWTVTAPEGCVDNEVPNLPPIGNDDSAETDEGTSVTVDVLQNDWCQDGDPMTATPIDGSCSNGDMIIDSTGTATYTPNTDFCGTDACDYTVSDHLDGSDTATVFITVNCVNDPPIAEDDSATTPEDTDVTVDVLENDSDTDGGDLTATEVEGSCGNGDMSIDESSGTATYSPDTSFCGTDACEYTLSDGEGGSDSATVYITVTCEDDNNSGGVGGDPHFKTWAGEHFDYHGLCDLVLLKNNGFQDGLGMDIHIRTKKMSQFSHIANAVLRIGEDSLEVTGSSYWINGVQGDEIRGDNAILSTSISGYPINFRRINVRQREFSVDLGDGEIIAMKTWTSLVRVDVIGATMDNFGGSRGLMGKFNSGEHLARDDVTELKDMNAFGQEWQVQLKEPKLFRYVEGAQSPQLCVAPSAVETRRRLRESSISQEQAEIACSRVNEMDRELCVFDVMATNHLDLAGAY